MAQKFTKERFRRNFFKITILIFFILVSTINIFSVFILSKKKDISGFSTHEEIQPGESNTYHFSNNIQFGVSTNVFINFDINYENTVQNRAIIFNITNDNPISLQVNAKSSLQNFSLTKNPRDPQDGNYQWRNQYNCYYQLKSDVLIKNLTIQIKLGANYGLDPNNNHIITITEAENESWSPISTKLLHNVETDETYLESSFINLEPNTQYYITVYEAYLHLDIWILTIIIIVVIVAIGLTLIISKTDFLNYLKNRISYIDQGAHRLTLDEVLENKNRNKIIDLILTNTGIHFNELLRQTELAAGNLVWHLDILETYKIIGKKRIGNYMAYFPYYDKNPISNIDLKIQKSKTTLEILQLIERNPGIYNNLITKRFKVDHKTIHYHVNKLLDLGIVYLKKQGKKKKIYPNLDSEYYNGKKI